MSMIRQTGTVASATWTLRSTILALGIIAAMASARGETSSWSKRAPEAPPQATEPNAAGTQVRLRQSITEPTTQPGLANPSPTQGPLPNLKTPLGASTAEPSGPNAAYMAFEMGLYGRALALAKADFEKKVPSAATLLGMLYANGLGVAKDEKTAIEWYRRGAELGDPEGTFSYGLALATGDGVEKDPKGAAEMFEKAALKGHAYANYNLALSFLSGNGKPENPTRAAQHLRFAADRGIARAQYDLATLYRTGHGVDADAYLASYWLRQAAASGLTVAQYEYGVALLQGAGLNEDKPFVVDYLRSAAVKGLSGAQNRLAYVFLDGSVQGQNLFEAAKWRAIARAGGFKDDELDRKIAEIPNDVRAKADAAARTFLEQIAAGETTVN